MSITENAVEFKSLEKKVYEYVCKCGCEIIDILESYDEEIRENRDKEEYRNKGKRRRTIKTVMGEIEFESTNYETRSEENEKRYEYLLDKELGLSRSGFFSELMSEIIAKRCCESSYRNAAHHTIHSRHDYASFDVTERILAYIDHLCKLFLCFLQFLSSSATLPPMKQPFV